MKKEYLLKSTVPFVEFDLPKIFVILDDDEEEFRVDDGYDDDGEPFAILILPSYDYWLEFKTAIEMYFVSAYTTMELSETEIIDVWKELNFEIEEDIYDLTDKDNYL